MITTKYFVIEKKSFLGGGTKLEIEAKNLTRAKRRATAKQYHPGTILIIENEQGKTLAVKELGGLWVPGVLYGKAGRLNA